MLTTPLPHDHDRRSSGAPVDQQRDQVPSASGALGDPDLTRARVGASVQTAVRRRRVLSILGFITVALGLGGLAAPVLWWAAVAMLALMGAYLALVARIRHLAVERDMSVAFGTADGDFDWEALRGYVVVPDHGGVETPAAARVRPFALSRFVIAYLVGWILTPIVAVVHLAGGDLSDLERHGVLERLVSWQRYGRAQSLRVLAVSVATAAGVTAAGGLTGTAMAAPAAASTSPQAGSTYTVQPGDTLGSIAAAHGRTVAALASANRLADPNLVYAGQVLTLPAGAGSPSAASGPSYTVQAGDTVGAIAERFGTTVVAVASANHMVDANQISVGQTIVVAGGHVPATTTASTSQSGSSYTVQAGDTLNRIAARYGTTAAALASLNHIADPNVITVGQVLAVSGQAPASTAAPAPAPVQAPAPVPATTVSFGYTLPPPAPAPVAPAAPTSAAATAVKVALAQIGKPYLYGGSGPSSFDCSGLVMYAYAAAGIPLPHYTVAQYQDTTHISQGQLQPGDLVFYGGSAPSHVAMYIGGGQVVSANSTGTTIQTQSITWDGTPTGFSRVA